MPYNEDKGYHEPAVNREDLARQAAEAAKAEQDRVNVPVAGADALVDAAAQDLPADETNDRIAEARHPAQQKVDQQRAEAEGVTEPEGPKASTKSSSPKPSS